MLVTALGYVYTQDADSKNGNTIFGSQPVGFQSHVGAQIELMDTQCLEKTTMVVVDSMCKWWPQFSLPWVTVLFRALV